MAINVNLIPQLQTLTKTSTGKTFTISSDDIIEFYNNGAGTNITYISQKGTTSQDDVDESVSTINTASGRTQAVSELYRGNTKTVYMNSNRIVSFKAITNAGDGVICLMEYKALANAPIVKKLKTAVATINSAAGNTFKVVAVATSNTPTTNVYINSLLVDRLVKDTSESAIVLSSATVAATAGTRMIAGLTVLTLTGGTFTTAATATVTHTKVVSATVAAGGTGNLGNGAGVIVEGTTGTGTKFRASVTIATNAIASVQSITIVGNYTVNPTDTSAEPVTYISGASSGTTLTGAQLTIVMGALTVVKTKGGTYSVAPTNPITTTGSSGTNPTLTGTFETGTVTGCQILYNRQGTAFQLYEVEETAAQIIATQNAL